MDVGYVKCANAECNMQWWPREGWPFAKKWYCEGCCIATLEIQLAVAVAALESIEHVIPGMVSLEDIIEIAREALRKLKGGE